MGAFSSFKRRGIEESFHSNYAASINEALALGGFERNAKWTESLAVGRESFVTEISRSIRNRMRVETQPGEKDQSQWTVRESGASRYLEAFLDGEKHG